MVNFIDDLLTVGDGRLADFCSSFDDIIGEYKGKHTVSQVCQSFFDTSYIFYFARTQILALIQVLLNETAKNLVVFDQVPDSICDFAHNNFTAAWSRFSQTQLFRSALLYATSNHFSIVTNQWLSSATYDCHQLTPDAILVFLY